MQTLSFAGIALGPVEGEPDSLHGLGIVRTAREQVPVQVRHLIAQEFAVHLARLEGRFDGVRERDHFFEKRLASHEWKVVQFGGVHS